MDGFWAQVKFQIKQTIPDHSYRMWIDPIELLECKDDCIRLSTPNEFFARRLKENYQDLFEKEFNKLGQSVRIEFKTGVSKHKNGDNTFAATVLPSKSKIPVQASLPGFDLRFNSGRMLKKGYTFDNFVVGDNSSFAYSASLSLAHGKMNGAGILYLLAKTGLGKSHLSQHCGCIM